METQEKTGHRAGTIALAALGGAAVGAAVSLLLAPKSGRETRQQIIGYVDTAKGTVARVPEAWRQASQAARDVLGQTAAPVRNGRSHHA